jgi:hypothetical protein
MPPQRQTTGDRGITQDMKREKLVGGGHMFDGRYHILFNGAQIGSVKYSTEFAQRHWIKLVEVSCYQHRSWNWLLNTEKEKKKNLDSTKAIHPQDVPRMRRRIRVTCRCIDLPSTPTLSPWKNDIYSNRRSLYWSPATKPPKNHMHLKASILLAIRTGIV